MFSAAPLATQKWIIVKWMRRYTLELNDITLSWRDLKRYYLVHGTFNDTFALDAAIHEAVGELKRGVPDGSSVGQTANRR